MMIRFATPLMAAVLMNGAALMTHAQNAPQATPAPDANTLPAGNTEAQQAYQDGMLAAKLDTVAKRPIDPKMSHLYKKPPVKGPAQAAYRAAFESGYEAALKNGGSL